MIIYELKKEVVPLKGRISVSMADASINLIQLIIVAGIGKYFMEVRGLDAGYVAIVWLMFGIWNALNDPLFGFISDKTKSSLGRRIPYIRYGAPIIAITYIISWINWGAGPQWLLFLQMLTFLFLYDTLYTAVATALYVMPFEMAIGNKARGTIFIWKMIFSLIVTLAALLIPLVQPDPNTSLGAFQLFHIIIGVAVGLLVFFSTYFYKENHYLQEEKTLPFFQAIIETLKNRSFLVFEVISFTIIYNLTALLQGFWYYIEIIGFINAISLVLSLVVGVFVGIITFVQKIESWGVKKCMALNLSSFAVGCFLILFFGFFTISWVVPLPTMLGFVGLGIGFAGGYYVQPIMNGEVIDKDEELTGLRREGMYGGVNSLITKPAISLASAVFIWITLFFGYNHKLDVVDQTATAHIGLVVGWVLVPAILLLLCVLAMRFYPLDGEAWVETKEKLARLHQDKEEAYLRRMGLIAD